MSTEKAYQTEIAQLESLLSERDAKIEELKSELAQTRKRAKAKRDDAVEKLKDALAALS